MAHVLIYWKRLHRFVGWKLYIPLVGIMAISTIEGAGYFLLVALLGLVGLFDPSSSSIPFLSDILEPVHAFPIQIALTVVLLVFLAIWIGQAVIFRYLSMMNEKITHGFVKYMRLGIYESILHARWPFFLKQRKSDFVHIMTSELHRVNYGVQVFLGLILQVLFTLVQIAIAFWMSFQLTATLLICGLALSLYSRKFVHQSRKFGDQATELTQTYMAGMTDHFNGIKDIKSNLMEEQHISWFRALCDRMERNSVQFMRLQNTSQFFQKLVSGLLITVFIFVSLVIFQVQAEKLLFIIIIFSRLWPRFSSIQSRWEQLAQSLPAFGSLLNLEREYEAAGESRDQLDLITENMCIERDMECQNVYYRYDKELSAYALQNINLKLPANSMTAIAGKSGAGKSTLVDLLIGLIEPEAGTIKIDGVSLTAEKSLNFRRSVGYVSQDPFLFHTTIRENLCAAAPNATEEEIWEALRFAASDELVRKLPEGLNTVVGDRGIRLSGGERQRIVLARAILRKPSFLVLDEATSALDSENEAIIQVALERLRGNMTIVVIAHRLSTLRNADQVIVLDQGRIIQQGSFNQLSKESNGIFGQLLAYQAQ